MKPLLGALLAGAVAACSKTDPVEEFATRILPSSDYTRLATISLVPGDLLCGADLPDCVVERGGRVELLDSGRVAFAGSIRDKQIRVTDGHTARFIGREGSGPGEYRSVIALGHTRANTLRVFDLLQHRVIEYGIDGQTISTSLVPVPAQGFTGAQFVDGDLRILAIDPSTRSGDSARVAWFASATGARRSRKLRTLSARQRAYSIQDLVPVKPPFAPAPRWAVNNTGALLFSSGADLTVDVFDSTGAHTLRFGFDKRPRPVTSVDLDRWRANSVRGLPASMQAAIRNSERSAAIRHPGITQIRALQNGEVWVREAEEESGDMVRWIVFDSTFSALGTVSLPVDDDVVAARGGLVLISQPATRRGLGILRWFARGQITR